MNTWFRKVGMGALALTLAGVLGGCNNGSGGLLRLFFGINGQGSCNQVIVEVDLSEADAIIAQDEEGDFQCVLNTLLDNAGCQLDLELVENGDVLRATINGCTIPEVTNLFSCLFEHVDISALQESASAQCTCHTQGCDGNPPVCISPEPDPEACEDCNNGKDDDGNGLIDCEDPNCEHSPECNPSSTTTHTTSTTNTVTTSTTNSTTTTSTTTTSTTLETFPCTLIFRLADDVSVGALQWDTDYSNAPGFLQGSGGSVDCDNLAPDSFAEFNDVDAEENLDTGIISSDGFSGPVNVSQCIFRATTTPLKSDFPITVTSATDPDLNEIDPLPSVVIESIDCNPPVTTTSTTVTTTTGEPTTTTTGEPGTTTTAGDVPKNYFIFFTINSIAQQGKLAGAVQFTADYNGAPGAFQGAGSAVTCSNQVDGAFAEENDNEATKELSIGVISSDGYDAPRNLDRCTFNGFAADPPVPGDFTLTIDDSTDTDGVHIDVTLGVTVTPI